MNLSEQTNKLLVSFSGGETSAYMAQWLKKEFDGWKEMVFVFANTGEENEETLIFADKCDKAFGLNLVWIESVMREHGRGPTFKIVNFETASRNGKPFEGMIQKHGIPNINFPHCSRELKGYPIRAYARSMGWKKADYKTAIGIRSDEMDRISENFLTDRLWYPLVEAGVTKIGVNRFWRDQPFRLELKGYEGNCKTCWKKSFRKLIQIAKDNPEKFDNFKKWEAEYSNMVIDTRPNQGTPPFYFFRKNKSVADIMEMAKHPIEPPKDDSKNYTYYEQTSLFDVPLDTTNGCVEACEPF